MKMIVTLPQGTRVPKRSVLEEWLVPAGTRWSSV
jgi:hypothetical protein